MRLKSLELQGFKSFPDKTTLYFDDGATVIVGPNGSGKSNVTDAMRWVLGEISSKNIRGSKMEDVIFIGTEIRKPMSFAEVSVTFDNATGEGRLDSPYDTVTVTRRYYRAGEGEYFINRNQVRRKDIELLFKDTGVGREGYSIIGQGRIAEIISKKSEDRRNIFEEAAGIAKFRDRKEESEKKLKQTEDNMDRVYDIFNELAMRVGPLEKDAEKAKKYHELYEKKKVADVSLWIYDSQKTKNEIIDTTNNFNLSKHELEITENSIRQIEAQDSALYEKLLETRKESERIYYEIKNCNATLSDLNSEIKVMETNVQNAKFTSNAQIEELEKILAKKEMCEKEIKDKELTYDQVNEQLSTAIKHEDELKDRLAQLEKRRIESEVELEELLEKQKALELEKADIIVRISVLENSQTTGDERIESLKSDISKYQSTLDELYDRLESLTKTVGVYENSLSQTEDAISKLNDEIDTKTLRYDELKEEMNILNSKKLALRERINALSAMEELFDGYAKSVSYIMNAYNSNEIYNCGVVYGPVSTLLSVSEKYITAIETALGAGLQHIVVDNENTAKACILALKENKAGRATFYPISSVSGQAPTQEMLNAKKYKGYIGVADELISFDSQFKKIFSSLLGRTIIFDNIDNATEMAKEQNYKIKVVTLDGQQINVGGSFTGGSVKHESTVLSRSNDIKKMEQEESEICEKLDVIKLEGQKLGEALRNLTSKRQGEKQQYDLTDALYRAEKTDYDTLVAQIEINKNIIESLEFDTNKLNKEDERNQTETVNLKHKRSELEENIQSISNMRKDLDTKKYELIESSESLQEEINQSQIKIAIIKKDIESAVASILDSKARFDEIVEDIESRKEKMELLNQTVSNSAAKTAENKTLLAEAENRLEKLDNERIRLSNLETEYEAKRNQLSQKTKEITAKKEVVLRSYTMSEGKLEQLNLDFDKMVEKLEADYGLTYTTAIELGYPEVTSENRKEIAAIATECRNKLRNLGHVNPNAIEEYKEVKERYDYYNTQLTDLNKSKEDLLAIIQELETDMTKIFINAFNAINENFNSVFKELFGGGHAELSLTDENDVLNCGIEIKAAPPGKVIKSLMLLSGGEQSFVAIALLFAILKVNPTPFCIFDEVEAALDDVNVNRFGQYIKRYSDQTQFIVITHRRGTMEIADRLYGVTMPQKGISKVLTMDINDVGKDRILKENNQK